MVDSTGARDLGDGLRLRWATPSDAERIAALNARVFRATEDDPPSEHVSVETLNKMGGDHPMVAATDFAIVEERRTGAIVASSCLQRQTWDYGGIHLPIGRPEIVATDPDYRNRGLIRAIFGALHARSDGRGDLAQAITGIAYFYRQFGYEYAVDLEGDRIVPLATMPDAPEGELEPYTLRPATLDDLTFIMDLYDRRRAGLLVSAVVPEAFWRAALTASDPRVYASWRLHLIVDRAGVTRGYLRLSTRRWANYYVLWDIAVEDDVSPRAVALPVLRALRALGAAAEPGTRARPFDSLMLLLGRDHPFYTAVGESVAPIGHPPYAWYVRVPDLLAFLRRITPVLERRLAASPLANHSGDLRLDFYREGLRLALAGGRVKVVEPWQQARWGARQGASFPPLVFLQLLFGRRSLAELREAYPDVETRDDETIALLGALFPRGRSLVMTPE